MFVCQVNYTESAGGAARAARRLHLGLNAAGCKSIFLAQSIQSNSDHTLQVQPRDDYQNLVDGRLTTACEKIQRDYIDRNRTAVSQTEYSFAYPGLDLTDLFAVLQARIVHLHWINRFLSPVSVKRLIDVGKPIVWTLHDEWPFTAGPHYTAGCQQFADGRKYGNQLRQDPLGLAWNSLQDAIELYKDGNITIVTPSHWLAGQARKSLAFKNFRIEVIPNALETDIYQAPGQAQQSVLRQALSIPEDAFVIGLGAHSLKEKRKGARELFGALEAIQQEVSAKEATKLNLHLLVIGRSADLPYPKGFTFTELGNVNDDGRLAEIISLMNLFVLPSLEDNYPNMVIEAMACEVPVIGYNIGGIPDVIEHGKNGWIVDQVGDTSALAQAILTAARAPEKTKEAGLAGRRLMEDTHTLNHQADAMIELYRDIVDGFDEPLTKFESRAYKDAVRMAQKRMPAVARTLFEFGPFLGQPKVIASIQKYLD